MEAWLDFPGTVGTIWWMIVVVCVFVGMLFALLVSAAPVDDTLDAETLEALAALLRTARTHPALTESERAFAAELDDRLAHGMTALRLSPLEQHVFRKIVAVTTGGEPTRPLLKLVLSNRDRGKS